MRIEVFLPDLGDEDDAVQGGVVAFWPVQPGAMLEAGDDLLELTTDKAAFVVPSPARGRLIEQCVREGELVLVGDLLCVLETAA